MNKIIITTKKELSGKLSDFKKKKTDLEKLLIRILFQHKELDKNEKAINIQKPYSKTLGEDKERRKKHVERIEAKLKKINDFLNIAEPKLGPSGQEVQSNITDHDSARIKGPHGYIQGYNGIAVADSGNQIIVAALAIGSGAESGCFPYMLDSLEDNMKMVTRKKKPLKDSIVL